MRSDQFAFGRDPRSRQAAIPAAAIAAIPAVNEAVRELKYARIASRAAVIVIAAAGATEGCTGALWFYAPIPIFAVGFTVAVMNLTAYAGCSS
jgi:hypothetical protein